MPDKSEVVFSQAPSGWLQEVVGGLLLFIPEQSEGNSDYFGRLYAARLLRERGS